MKSKLISVILVQLILIYGFESKAQELDLKSVSGVVTAFSHFHLNKVEIVALKSGGVAYTDSSGLFTIKCNSKDVLTFTASGFHERKIKVGKQTIYKIDLLYVDNVSNFNNAVNNGHITAAALKQAVNANQAKKEKDYSIYSSVYELIRNEIFEVNVKNNGVFNKKIRSFNSNPQVLYVVDGKVVSDISFVSPVDVDSIEFIDDVGATLWGVQGANGVLKITLKR
jgi:hypothetical protein